MTVTVYSRPQVEKATLEYFEGDELATNVFVTKYALRTKEGDYLELTPQDMHERLAREFARIEHQFGGKRALSYDQILRLFEKFRYVVPQGSPMQGIGNNEVITSLSNCMVVAGPEDTMSSIMDTGKKLANLMKRRCGVGTDLSNLRPEGASVNNAALSSTGAWSFADFYSYVCRMIALNGRRGALMLTMHCRHPDIFKFVTMKQDLKKVTGANVSVKITDDFMKAVVKDEEFTLQFPCEVPLEEATYTQVIRAKDLWELIVESATQNAEPGVLMWDNILRELPAECYADLGFNTISTNPCSEIPLSVDSCRLISLCLKDHVKNPFTEEAFFDYDEFQEVTTVAMRLSDDLVELELEKIHSIIKMADPNDEKALWEEYLKYGELGRRVGLGTHGLADCLARLGVAYDSEEALFIVDRIYHTFKESAYGESVELAKERGAFPIFDWEREKDNAFIQRLSDDLKDAMRIHGRRNIAILTNAPTGSVSIESQSSSGIEPVFRNSYKRRRRLGHDEGHIAADFVDAMGDRWQNFEVYHHNAREYMDLTGNSKLPSYFVESDTIDWKKRVELQSVTQRHIDHAISSTINLPKGTKAEVVAQIYLEGWKKGLKGITVYVDGCRDGVLITDNPKSEGISYHDSPKRPDVMECDIHHPTIKGERWVVLVGLLDGKPYEVMGGLQDEVQIPVTSKKGEIHKRSYQHINRYDLHLPNGGLIKNINSQFNNPDHSIHTRMISLALRHGVRPHFVVEQLLKDPDSNLTSFSKVVARTLSKHYVVDGTKVSSEKTCPECKGESLIYVEGCVTCTQCGFSKCG